MTSIKINQKVTNIYLYINTLFLLITFSRIKLDLNFYFQSIIFKF